MAKGISKKQTKADLRNLELRMKKLNEIDIPVAYENAIIDNEGVLLELLQEQLKSGISGSGDPITLYGDTEYHPFTKRYKKEFGQGVGSWTDRITLYMFGSFYAEMFTTAKGSQYTIKSAVPYYDDIIRKSGPDVMLLTPESQETFLTLFINPIIQQVIKEALTV